jgi:FKBP-type peptidyl-prolyl cis-trans isomerase (trigger factor)
VDRLIQGYGQAYQIDEARLGDFAKEFRPMAESQVRRDLLLDSVVESEKLAATEAEIDARVAAMAQARGLPVGQLYAQLEKANRLRDLERGITEEKAFAWLLQQSTVEESAN